VYYVGFAAEWGKCGSHNGEDIEWEGFRGGKWDVLLFVVFVCLSSGVLAECCPWDVLGSLGVCSEFSSCREYADNSE
jgi:hypothetical protein